MIWSTIERFSATAPSPARSNRLKSASTVLWSSLSSVIASMARRRTHSAVGAHRCTGHAAGMSMTYGIHLPQYGRVASGEAVARAARHAEDLGFADVWVSDHVVHPAEQDYPSPYLLDPFATLS